MTPVHQIGVSDVIILLLGVWLFSKVVRMRFGRRGVKSTHLQGPASKSIIFGLSRYLMDSKDTAVLYEQWAAEYGPAFRFPTVLRSSRTVICDPKAIAHFYSKETFTYLNPEFTKIFIERLFGRGLLWAEGESHKRQRKALSPAFSNAAIRKLTSVFYDSSYKMKAAWDSILESSPDAIIDVEKWMNHISLDSIGIAGFSHDFGTLQGKHSSVAALFDSFANTKPSPLSTVLFILSTIIPVFQRMPTNRNMIMKELHAKMREIADELLERMRKEKGGELGEEKAEKSIIGLLIKAEGAGAELHMSREEVLAQNVLLLAGYETTSISLTWALIELSRNPEKQVMLREELAQFANTDPTWEQLSVGLPYLDSVVHEILRLHPPVSETTRVAAEDDVLPLSTSLVTASGETVDRIAIAKGTVVTAPVRLINRSEVFWGPTAKQFIPERWLDDPSQIRAKEIQGHRHLLSFIDGPRTCLGKGFALAEFKAVLSVLIRNYTFEFPDGPETKIERQFSILPRPKIAGQDGPKVPLRIRRVE